MQTVRKKLHDIVQEMYGICRSYQDRTSCLITTIQELYNKLEIDDEELYEFLDEMSWESDPKINHLFDSRHEDKDKRIIYWPDLDKINGSDNIIVHADIDEFVEDMRILMDMSEKYPDMFG